MRKEVKPVETVHVDPNFESKAKRTIVIKPKIEKKEKKPSFDSESEEFSLEEDEEEEEDKLPPPRKIEKKENKAANILPTVPSSPTIDSENRLIIHYQSPELKKKKKKIISLDSWTKNQNEQLHQAIDMVPIKSSNYWSLIAAYVDGKTAKECQIHYQDRLKTPKRTKKPKLQPIILNELQTMKGKVGKKRKMRMLLKHADLRHTDDIFEADMGENVLDDSLDCSFDDKNFIISRNVNSSSSTTENSTDSPGILRKVKMDDIDTYLNKIRTGKVGVIKKEFVKKKLQVNKKLFNEIGSGITFNEVSEDSEEENDYYFE